MRLLPYRYTLPKVKNLKALADDLLRRRVTRQSKSLKEIPAFLVPKVGRFFAW
jgi:hypothetical protein